MAGRVIVNSGIKTWNVDRLPNLTGKTYLITGGNTGLGLETARHLGRAGANLVLACRSMDKAEFARETLRSDTTGEIELVQLDLADLASVRRAAIDVHNKVDKLDALINNAGIMQCPSRKTRDGFEMQVGTNHLGHFLFSGLLLGLVEAASGRIVTLTSVANRSAPLNFKDYMSEDSYSPTGAYIQAKLSNLLFAFELDQRLKDAGSPAISIACHPGFSNTNLQSSGPTGLLHLIYKLVNPLFAQAPDRGALPTVLAAAGTEARRGGYYGPQAMNEFRGLPGDAKVPEHALNKKDWKQLWTLSEELVDFQWSIPASPTAKS